MPRALHCSPKSRSIQTTQAAQVVVVEGQKPWGFAASHLDHSNPWNKGVRQCSWRRPVMVDGIVALKRGPKIWWTVLMSLSNRMVLIELRSRIFWCCSHSLESLEMKDAIVGRKHGVKGFLGWGI
ncbi:hypothetical protein COP1_034779 [Malus domestica]